MTTDKTAAAAPQSATRQSRNPSRRTKHGMMETFLSRPWFLVFLGLVAILVYSMCTGSIFHINDKKYGVTLAQKPHNEAKLSTLATSFSFPANGGEVDHEFVARGTHNGNPAEENLFVIVRGIDGYVFPFLHRARFLENNIWESKLTVGMSTNIGEYYELSLIIVPKDTPNVVVKEPLKNGLPPGRLSDPITVRRR